MAQEFDGGARGNPGLAGAGAVVYDSTTREEVKPNCSAPTSASHAQWTVACASCNTFKVLFKCTQAVVLNVVSCLLSSAS